MYLPPLSGKDEVYSTWEYRKSLLRERIGLINADVVVSTICAKMRKMSSCEFVEYATVNRTGGIDGLTGRSLFASVNLPRSSSSLCTSHEHLHRSVFKKCLRYHLRKTLLS